MTNMVPLLPILFLAIIGVRILFLKRTFPARFHFFFWHYGEELRDRAIIFMGASFILLSVLLLLIFVAGGFWHASDTSRPGVLADIKMSTIFVCCSVPYLFVAIVIAVAINHLQEKRKG